MNIKKYEVTTDNALERERRKQTAKTVNGAEWSKTTEELLN